MFPNMFFFEVPCFTPAVRKVESTHQLLVMEIRGPRERVVETDLHPRNLGNKKTIERYGLKNAWSFQIWQLGYLYVEFLKGDYQMFVHMITSKNLLPRPQKFHLQVSTMPILVLQIIRCNKLQLRVFLQLHLGRKKLRS